MAMYNGTMIKEFSSKISGNDLEDQVNKFISQPNIDIIDIQFSTSSSQDKYSTSVIRYYMIWYKSYDREYREKLNEAGN